MTESEWLASTNPAAMMEFLNPSSPHEGRLCVQRISDRKLRLFACACCVEYWKGTPGCQDTYEQYEDSGHPMVNDGNWAESWCKRPEDKPSLSYRAALLREIIGNPFRRDHEHVPFHHKWRSNETVLSIANRIYDERAFDLMPILADALEEAGCVNEDVLNHCRAEMPHVRGCWVVDLLLGKE